MGSTRATGELAWVGVSQVGWMLDTEQIAKISMELKKLEELGKSIESGTYGLITSLTEDQKKDLEEQCIQSIQRLKALVGNL